MRKKLVVVIAMTAILSALSSAAYAADAKTSVPNVKLPYTFTCKQCHIKMTVKQPADWDKSCWVCPCGEKAVNCQPKAK